MNNLLGFAARSALAVLLSVQPSNAETAAEEAAKAAPAEATTTDATEDAATEAPPAQPLVNAAKPNRARAISQRAIELQRRRISALDDRVATNRAVVAESAKHGASADGERLAVVVAKATVERDLAKRDAAQTTLAVLQGKQVAPLEAKRALEVELAELERLAATKGAEDDAEASRFSAAALNTAAAAVPAADAAVATSPETDHRVQEFARGDRLRYGPTVSLVRVSALRDPAEPGRLRNYEARYEIVPAEFGFQFLFAPHNTPWRYVMKDGKQFQLLSAGGVLLARIDQDDVQRGNLSLAITLNFFEEILGLGVGVDLYRGVPVQGADGVSGSDTAFTGLLAWSLTRRGEVTPENVFFVVTLGLEPLVRSITGEL